MNILQTLKSVFHLSLRMRFLIPLFNLPKSLLIARRLLDSALYRFFACWCEFCICSGSNLAY